MKKVVNAFIEPVKAYGVVEEHRMNIEYNGTSAFYLHQNPDAASFASCFKRKLKLRDKDAIFTDYYGISVPEKTFNSVLCCITGLDDINESIISLITTCTNLDIQSDLIVHVGEKKYPIVSDVDNKEYFARDTCKLSKKGYSMDVLIDIANKIEELKKGEKYSLIENRK